MRKSVEAWSPFSTAVILGSKLHLAPIWSARVARDGTSATLASMTGALRRTGILRSTRSRAAATVRSQEPGERVMDSWVWECPE